MGYSISATKVGVIATVSLIVLLGMGFNGTNHVFAHESDAKRYSDGYDNGFAWYADHPNDGANNCDPDRLYTSDGTHTDIYCNGWATGYTAASNSGSANSGTQQGQSSDVNIRGNGNHVDVNQGQSNSGGGNDGNQAFRGNNPRCVVLCSTIR